MNEIKWKWSSYDRGKHRVLGISFHLLKFWATVHGPMKMPLGYK